MVYPADDGGYVLIGMLQPRPELFSDMAWGTDGVMLETRRRLTHLTLGVFLATFVVALNALIEIRVDPGSLVPRVTVSLVYLLVLVTLATFITFLHGMVRMLRVQYLLHRVTADGRAAMLRAFPEPAAYRESPAPDASAPVTVRSRVRTGVLQSVDRAALVRLAL